MIMPCLTSVLPDDTSDSRNSSYIYIHITNFDTNQQIYKILKKKNGRHHEFQNYSNRLGLDVRKPVFRVSVKASFKPVSSATETS